MTDLVPTNHNAVALDLAKIPTEQLQEELRRTLEVTVESLVRTAAIVRELEHRGIDLSELRIGLAGYLRQIAHGRLSAKAVVRFAERPLLLRAVSDLPLEEQERLADGEPVKLAVFGDHGQVDHRMVDPLDLSADQIRLIFGGPVIRSVSQQVPLLEDRRVRATRRASSPASGRITADRERGGLIVRKTFFPIAEVIQAMAGLSSTGGGEAEQTSLVVKIGVDEHRRLKIRAAEAGTSVAELVRTALRAYGMI